MKKYFLSLAAIVLIVFYVLSCKKNNPIDCASKLSKIFSTQATYLQNDNTENCKAYGTALNDYLNSCGSILSATDRANYEGIISGINCP